MEQKLIFLDIDGTFTKAGENVPPESAAQAVRQARANGHKVFICTGRNERWQCRLSILDLMAIL